MCQSVVVETVVKATYEFVKAVLCLIKHRAMEMCGGVKEQIHGVTSALDEGEWCATHTGRLSVRKEHPRDRSPMPPRTGLDAVEWRKTVLLLLENESRFHGRPGRSVFTRKSQVANGYKT